MNASTISGWFVLALEGGHWSPFSDVFVAAKTWPAASA
jgi:hypothetical protein